MHELINLPDCLSSFSVVQSSSQILISLQSDVSDEIETMGGDTAVLVVGEVTLATVAQRTVLVVVEVGGDVVTVIVVGVVAVVAGEGDEVREWPLCVAPCWDTVMIELVCT